MPINIEITSAKLLLVEGLDTKKFFEAVQEKLGVREIQILDFGGIKDPTKLPANALKAGYIPWEHPQFKLIKRFLEEL